MQTQAAILTLTSLVTLAAGCLGGGAPAALDADVPSAAAPDETVAWGPLVALEVRVANATLVPDGYTVRVPVGRFVRFDASQSHDPAGDAVVVSWDFGTGAPALGPVVERQWDSEGLTHVTLTVADHRGGASHATLRIEVVAQQPPPPPPRGTPAGVVREVFEGTEEVTVAVPRRCQQATHAGFNHYSGSGWSVPTTVGDGVAVEVTSVQLVIEPGPTTAYGCYELWAPDGQRVWVGTAGDVVLQGPFPAGDFFIRAILTGPGASVKITATAYLATA